MLTPTIALVTNTVIVLVIIVVCLIGIRRYRRRLQRSFIDHRIRTNVYSINEKIRGAYSDNLQAEVEGDILDMYKKYKDEPSSLNISSVMSDLFDALEVHKAEIKKAFSKV